MRGSSLSDKAIIKELRPCIVTSWTGRSTRDAPAEVQAVYRQLKERYRFNIVLFLLDANGKLVDSLLPVPNKEGRQVGTQILRSGSWLRDRIATALRKVEVDPDASAEEKVNAPDVDDLGLEEGIRLTILFDPERGGQLQDADGRDCSVYGRGKEISFPAWIHAGDRCKQNRELVEANLSSRDHGKNGVCETGFRESDVDAVRSVACDSAWRSDLLLR